MKTIVKLIMMVALATSFAVITVNAQPGYGHGKHGHGPGYGRGFGPDSCHLQLMVEDLADALSLTDKQKADILELHYAHMAEMKSISENYQNDCVGEREARIASHKKMDDAIKTILTPDQQTKYDEFMEERRGPHAHSHQHWK
jgi:Spy/CpxP family protein refolding chaperone